ncbi:MULTISPECIES: RNA polymerase sigma factor [Amycolatopsis]|uniref:RNA polymerase sigma-70 region 2 domain-containing protein n=1 Tax=Amycolatopsis dongchuanensis TaxID=1070866 RepID=A0ABP8VKT2_9PSEU
MGQPDFGPWLTAAAGGDETAWRLLVRDLSPPVLRVARTVGLDDPDTADVCQNTWLELVRCPGLRDPARLPSWLSTTARREAVRVLAARRRESPCPLPEPPGHAPSPEVVFLAAERDRALWLAVERLPWPHRELVHLLASPCPPTYAEIAGKLGIRPGSVGPLRRRALDRLRRLLEAQGYTRP